MFHDNDAHFINGITLNVRDLRTLQPFYEELLGFKKVEETLTAVKYQVGDSHHYITLREIKSGRNPLSQEAGLFYIGIQWFCCKVRKNITNYHFNMVVFP